MRYLSIFLIIALAFWSTKESRAAQAIPLPPPIVVTYDVYVGGVHLVRADILFEKKATKYHTRVQAFTYGFWHKVLPWDTLLESNGRIVKDHFVPIVFHNRDIWRSKPKVTNLRFTKNGDVTPSFDPPDTDNPNKREIVTAEQRHGSLDPVTALLQMLGNIAVEDSCAITVPVFDGKRRFDITGSDQGSDDIDEEDYSAYSGSARLCNADFKMIAGEWKDRKPTRFWQKSDDETGRDPFQIWLARPKPELPELPIVLESSSVLGRIMVHMSGWHYATKEELAAVVTWK